MRQLRLRLTSTAALVLLVALSAQAGEPAGASEPATWVQYNLLVDLQHLPKHYSCNDLWYRFRDVLWSIGARRISEILVYDCDRATRADAPRVHLAFSLPQPAQGAQAKQATLRGTPASVELRPGQPKSFDESDCALLGQINATLLAALPVRVSAHGLDCSAAAGRHPPFGLTVQALVPTTAGSG